MMAEEAVTEPPVEPAPEEPAPATTEEPPIPAEHADWDRASYKYNPTPAEV